MFSPKAMKWFVGVVTTVLVLWFFGHPVIHFFQEVLTKADTLVPGK